MRRILTAAVLAAAVTVTTACSQEPPPVSEKVQAYYEENSTLKPRVTLPLVAFIGDSYSAGTGASSEEKRWTTLLSASKKWQEDNFAQGGTGYLRAIESGGAPACGEEVCPNYQYAVPQVIADNPATVIVAGGQNDLGAFEKDPAPVAQAIDRVYAGLRKGLPKAKILAVGPSTPGEVTPLVAELDALVQEAARRHGAAYVSLIDPDVVEDDMVAPDGQHVTDAGHAAIAKRVAAALR